MKLQITIDVLITAIFSLIQVEVTAVLKSHNSTDWIVSYKRFVPGSFDLEEQTVRARYVILGAGAIGSTKILLRSKERGLDVSDEIGTKTLLNERRRARI